MGLKKLPDYSTLKRFGDRSHVAEIADAMFAEIICECALDAKELAVDSTGIQTTAASAYFQTRSGPKKTKYVKLSLAILCGSLLPCGLVVSWGPRTDRTEAPKYWRKRWLKSARKNSLPTLATMPSGPMLSAVSTGMSRALFHRAFIAKMVR